MSQPPLKAASPAPGARVEPQAADVPHRAPWGIPSLGTGALLLLLAAIAGAMRLVQFMLVPRLLRRSIEVEGLVWELRG